MKSAIHLQPMVAEKKSRYRKKEGKMRNNILKKRNKGIKTKGEMAEDREKRQKIRHNFPFAWKNDNLQKIIKDELRHVQKKTKRGNDPQAIIYAMV
ncbi:hypothetical protein CDAR_534331 [Caerostris darwini]|uniref:Uncharacterized protein n=1 Tax=Caerostris darwini TaxID=1538125 RepID=A0AAV4NVR8_9ARAC|nr:hypothetical protein CDAR_534331 [Caerostris darwini]